jgi:hypothetical protein
MTSLAEQIAVSTPDDAVSDATRFCRAVLPSAGHLCIQPFVRSKQPGPKHWATTADEAARVAVELDLGGEGDVYLSIASFHEPGRRREEDVLYKRDFYLDLDVGPGKPIEDKRAAVHALKDFCQASGVPFPAILIDSGRGLHAHWPLDRNLELVDWRRSAFNLRRACVRYGLQVDQQVTADGARILRIPGTWNHKNAADPRPVRLLHYKPPHDAVILASCFESAAGGDATPQSAAGALDAASDSTPAVSTAWFDNLPDEDRVDELIGMLEALPDADADDHSRWIQTLAQIASATTVPLETRVDLGWKFSRRSDKSRNESRESVERHMEGLGQRTNINALRNRAARHGYLPPLPLYKDKSSAEKALTARYVHVGADDVYYDTEQRIPLKKSALKERETSRMPRTGQGGSRLDPVSMLRNSSHTQRCDSFGYHPGAGKVFREDGRLLANLFRPYNPAPLTPTDHEKRLLAKFLRHLFPRRSDLKWLKHLLDTYAYLVQHPGERVKFSMILVGAMEGSGKSTLMEQIPRVLFGAQNVVTVSTHELESQFTDWLARAWIVVFAEVSLGTSRDAARVANALKDNQTNDHLRLIEKGKAGRTQRNRTSFFGTSNDETRALHLSAFDRRSAICATPAQMVPRKLAAELHAFLASPRAAGVLRTLAEHRDVSHFDPNAAPPMTEAKKRMIEASRHPIHAEIVDGFQSLEPPFHKDLVGLQDVRGFLVGHGVDVKNLTDRKLSEFLRLPPIAAQRMKHQRTISTGGITGRIRPWVLRHFELWKGASTKEIEQHLRHGTPLLSSVSTVGSMENPLISPSLTPGAAGEHAGDAACAGVQACKNQQDETPRP